MENASKALIIAGTILISILIISVGILIFNSSKGIADDASQAGGTISSKTEEVSKDIEVSLATSEITFEIDGKEYKAKEGMTWKQWVGSEYNKGYEDYKFGTVNITCEGEEFGIFTLVNGCSVFLSKNDKQVFR